MQKLLFILLCSPLAVAAQKQSPRFENDTLYTTTGFKMYKGQTLQFGEGQGKNGKFRYINLKSDVSSKSIANKSIVIRRLSHFGISALGNAYILVEGSIIFKDGSKGYIVVHMAFEKAMDVSTGMAAELIIPEEFKNNRQASVADEIIKLNKLYQDSIITKEQFELQKNKLLE